MSTRNAADQPVHIRPAAVAGKFYPAAAGILRKHIRHYMDEVDPAIAGSVSPESPRIRAIIAPHAGYRYSAAIAASAYTCLKPLRKRINRVVLIGPSHRVAFEGLACSSAEAFNTPLGSVPVDTVATRKLIKLHGIHINDTAHAPEHGLEVHLPLLIQTIGRTDEPVHVGFEIVPLLFGNVDDKLVAEVLDPFLEDDKTLVVVSSDLSHYLDYETAASVDRQTADAVVARRADEITPERACGHTCVRALLRCADARGLEVSEVDLRSSGDTAGPRDSVVGYGAFILR